MLAALTQLLLFQLVGEVLARSLAIAVPGPVLGMLLLLLFLVWRGGPGTDLQNTSSQLLQHLSLLFIPAGTGILVHWHRVGAEWWPLLVTLTLSTAVTLAVTALTMKLVQHLSKGRS
ncbi:MAG TPA: CidA/LrgA family protein [Macromonas sp.]|nr:CidA/LrgA family protein [Macromonas sp.]